ncbi:aminopeptidase [Brevundimonas sp. 2R-24]|uniref:Aminopeptidase n=1 Tax=Peiella sedimenti TaxID=3061083 RepID=A0ABT8SPA8_9CAUL|nr:aminopeptidase [Caulobacteraceae bacterium XZ-24]
MFGKVAAFEFRYQVRQPIFWVAIIIFTLLAFGLVASENVSLGGVGQIKENSPYALGLAHIAFCQFYMFVTTAFVANVVVRDDETGFGPIIRTTRIDKISYLGGRFTGAFLASALAYLAIPLGILIGTFMPWVDPETLGPNRVLDYLYAWGVLGLPTVFLTAALFFALATATRSMMATYIGVVVFLIGYIIASSTAGQRPEWEETVAYLEPFGIAAFQLATKYFTPIERNTLMPALEGVLLVNRVGVIVLGLVVLGAAIALFSPSSKGAKPGKAQKLKVLADKGAPQAVAEGPLPAPRFGAATSMAQLMTRTRFEMARVFKNPAYAILVLLGAMLAVAILWQGNEVFGTATYLTTRKVIETVQGAFGLFFIIIATYYAGELVWRERDRKTHEIIDASAAPDWTFTFPKVLALALVLVSTVLVSVLVGMAVQTLKGWTDYEIGKYLLWYVLPTSVDMILLAVLAVFLQVISPHKFVGWGLMLIYLIATLVMSNLGFQHNLYQYGGVPSVPLSDMNGQGYFWIGATWFRVYWSAFAIILLLLSFGLWRRGAETRFTPRLRRLPGRLKGATGVVAALALVTLVGSGVWIYVNTVVWNPYRTSQQNERWAADLERTLLRYENVARPTITDVRLDVDLFPQEHRVVTEGAYQLENQTGAPLQQVHVYFPRDLEVQQLTLPGAQVEREFERFNYRILRLEQPMAPGERRTLSFRTQIARRGFTNSGQLVPVLSNGTFLNHLQVSPTLGFNRSDLLGDPTQRRRQGLPAQLRPAKLENESARAFNQLRADFVNTDITVTTDADQTPIATGYVVSDVTHDGRRTARFRSEAPIMNFLSIQSGRFARRERMHNGIQMEVYYHPDHDMNVDRMLRTGEVSLDYYQQAFGPYQLRQFRFVEFPEIYGTFAQAYAGTMPWSEGIGFIANLAEPDEIDYVTYVGAHEIGHQWWAHQVVGGDMQGATALTETLAQYSALMVMERIYGPDSIRRFLKRELDNYLRSRAGEAIEELPLGRVENQQYIHYQKGGLAMYLLKDQMGEAAVNNALRSLVQQFGRQGAPYPTSRDLVAALRAQATTPEHQQLITDLFERITLWNVKTTGVRVNPLENGRFEVLMTVEAHKVYADGQGRETPTTMDSAPFDIGLFSARPGDGAFDREDVILMERRPLRDGTQTLRFVVDRRPSFGGADPYNKRIDRDSDDNVAAAE